MPWHPGANLARKHEQFPRPPSGCNQMLMTINSMGNSIKVFNGASYVKLWLRQGHHLAGECHIKEKITSLIPKNIQMF